MKVIILDAGHGGIDPETKEYVTAGKRSEPLAIYDSALKNYKYDVYYEGVGNREFVKDIKQILKYYHEIYENSLIVETAPSFLDVSLKDRVDLVNWYCDVYGKQNCLLVSIHSNAGPKEAHGWEVYTSEGNTKSDKIADTLLNNMLALLPDAHYRVDLSDGDYDKEKRLYMLENTKCPAILSENFFHTNRLDLMNYLLDFEARWKIAKAHALTIESWYF